MLFCLSRRQAASARFLAVEDTEVQVSQNGWTICVDAPVSFSHRNELIRDADRLLKVLRSGDKSVLHRNFFETLFGGHFAAIAFDESNEQVFILRDVAGAKTIYFADDGQRVVVGTVQSEVALALKRAEVSIKSVHMMMVLEHFLDGDTMYSAVSEVAMGTILVTERTQAVTTFLKFDLALDEHENGESQEFNARLLRDGILAAHESRAGSDNIVMLSGGIDSSVMLVALRAIVDRSRLRAVSFRVKGTDQDEAVYAKRTAKALDVPIDVVEVDPEDEKNFESFEQDLVAMNSPYMGRFVYGNLAGGSESMFFAGQDTRLHTPDLNRIDQFALSLLPLQKSPIGRSLAQFLVRRALDPALSLGANYAAEPRWRRGIYRAAISPDLDRYIKRFLLQIDEDRIRALGIEDVNAARYARSVAVDSAIARNTRHLYNLIVASRWRTQYTDDMRYLQDLGRLNATHVALPFYDIELARLSSGLPMAQTTRFVPGRGKFDMSKSRVNKALLREAFRNDLPEELLMRAKAVSNTQYLLFNGVIGQKIRAIFADDLAKGTDSIVRQLGVSGFVGKFLATNNYVPKDEAFLTRVFRIAAIAQINKRLAQ